MAENANSFRFDPNDRQLIRDKIKCLVLDHCIAEHEGDDVEQLLLVELWQHLPAYTPSRGSRRGYMVKLLDSAISNYLRIGHAKKRRPPSLISLDQRVKNSAGESVPLSETIADRDTRTRHARELSPLESAAWSIDLAEIMARLSERHRAMLTRLLRSASIKEIADDFGVRRSTIYRWLEQLKVRLREIDPGRFGNFDATNRD